MHKSHITLLASCTNQPGIIAALTQTITQHHGDISHLEQHVDAEDQNLFLRIQWHTTHADQKIWATYLDPVFQRYCLKTQLYDSNFKHRIAILASRAEHCLYDILTRHHSHELNAELVLIASNHSTLAPIAEQFDLPFKHCPIEQSDHAKQEAQLLDILKTANVDTLVLARYMQILSPEFLTHYPERIINIHHSFLPAFSGAKPYHQAWKRGVKLIGATSHFVTEALDNGPIITQSVTPISHQETVDALIQLGRNLEKITLSEALHLYLSHKILVHDQRTIVFK